MVDNLIYNGNIFRRWYRNLLLHQFRLVSTVLTGVGPLVNAGDGASDNPAPKLPPGWRGAGGPINASPPLA